ncbi:MAG: photosystem II core protein PsbZ [Hydrococcus sp. SU_1_0]|nr:photosystem II core protein PsbZ [Hydrococcus sp. SU_1_0]
MTILFQLALAALVLFSFVMVIGVPVAYASPKTGSSLIIDLCWIGSWTVLVVAVAVVELFVI